MSPTANNARVVIIGAGPAGLTAAFELVTRSQIRPLVLETSPDVGGISRTVEYKGNRMDIGGHRFFSKSDWVMDWWRRILPLPRAESSSGELLNIVPSEERVMLVRSRLSRIYFLRRFFDYPISLSLTTMRNLGLWRLTKIGVTYAWASVFPRPEHNLEDFFINRFGKELYRTFFKDYTEKVWGVPCREISPAWGAQRVKGLSVLNAIAHAGRKLVAGSRGGINQKTTQTSLIERFLYPKYGPGQIWQVVAERITDAGGELRHGCNVVGLRRTNDRISAVTYRTADGRVIDEPCDVVISTMPVRDLIMGMQPPAPPSVLEVAQGLKYRDFITVGVLLRKLKKSRYTDPESPTNLLPDTWIYIQEPDVRLGRLQCFNNWSPAMVRDVADTIWLGLEYFCDEGDDLWSRTDQDMGQLAVDELEKIGLIDAGDVLDFHVVHVPKAYPAYFGTYDRFHEVQHFTDGIENLFLVGRNGMHRYNNQDHSMLTARLAVDQILSGAPAKSAIWSINIDDDYHEEKSSSSS